jgi:predicted heme/steroid binding protein
VAYQGKVYDLTDSDLWMVGDHQGLHEAGTDLTDEFEDAPHEEEVFEDYEIVGVLVD